MTPTSSSTCPHLQSLPETDPVMIALDHQKPPKEEGSNPLPPKVQAKKRSRCILPPLEMLNEFEPVHERDKEEVARLISEISRGSEYQKQEEKRNK